MRWYQNAKLFAVALALLGIVSAVLLALLDKVSGTEALAFIGTGAIGALIGFLGGKPAAGAVVVGLVVVLSGCASWPQLAHGAAKKASAQVEPYYRAKCMSIAKTCPKAPLECTTLEACLAERRKIDAAISAVHLAIRLWADVKPLVDAVQ